MMHILNKIFDKIYVLTLENSFRMERMISRLDGINYEFFYGVNGATLDKTDYINLGSKQSRGQLGCTISHINLYKKIVDDNFDKVLILEDDAIFSSLDNLENLIKELPDDWGLFYLGFDGATSLRPNYSNSLAEISLQNFHVLHCTHAIAIRPWFAKKAIETNKNFLYTADGNLTETIKQHNLKAYAAIPKLINPDNLESITCNIDKEFGH